MRYRAGEPVRIADRPHEGHHRTPAYIKGKLGTVERAHRAFANPETLAYGGDGLPEQWLYLVSLAEEEAWPNQHGRGADRIYVDVFEHWLEAAG